VRIAVNATNVPDHGAGIGYYARKLYEALAESSEVERVVIFASAGAAPCFQGIHPKVEVRGYSLPGILAKSLFGQLILPMLARGFDVMHSVGNIPAFGWRGPQLVTVHDLCHKALPTRFGVAKNLYLAGGFALAERRPGIRMVCVSRNTRDDLLRWYPGCAGRATVVHSACKFPPVGAEEPRGDDLLCVGTLEPGKNLILAFRALALLKAEGITPRLNVVGAKGWGHSDLPRKLEELGVADQVRFLGRLDEEDLRRLYGVSRCLLFPSRYEGFGFPILEAQSQGCPAVVADNSCMREVGGAGSAVYFRDDDARALADAVRDLLGDGARQAELRARGFANVSRFSWKAAADGTLAAMRECVAEPSARKPG
jgi:glycosyltransferase involved in cell wall biosynthesis